MQTYWRRFFMENFKAESLHTYTYVFTICNTIEKWAILKGCWHSLRKITCTTFSKSNLIWRTCRFRAAHSYMHMNHALRNRFWLIEHQRTRLCPAHVKNTCVCVSTYSNLIRWRSIAIAVRSHLTKPVYYRVDTGMSQFALLRPQFASRWHNDWKLTSGKIQSRRSRVCWEIDLTHT